MIRRLNDLTIEKQGNYISQVKIGGLKLMNKTRIYTYRIVLENKIKRYEFTFVGEFQAKDSLEWLAKYKEYLLKYTNVYYSECESGKHYVYLRKKKHELSKGVSLV